MHYFFHCCVVVHNYDRDYNIESSTLLQFLGQGQAPCRQAVIGAGLPRKIICTTVNKVCASGMKSVILCADATLASPAHDNVYLAGGFESMTNAPHYIFHRGDQAKKLGHLTLLDANIHDGLWDVYNDQHMVG